MHGRRIPRAWQGRGRRTVHGPRAPSRGRGCGQRRIRHVPMRVRGGEARRPVLRFPPRRDGVLLRPSHDERVGLLANWHGDPAAARRARLYIFRPRGGRRGGGGGHAGAHTDSEADGDWRSADRRLPRDGALCVGDTGEDGHGTGAQLRGPDLHRAAGCGRALAVQSPSLCVGGHEGHVATDAECGNRSGHPDGDHGDMRVGAEADHRERRVGAEQRPGVTARQGRQHADHSRTGRGGAAPAGAGVLECGCASSHQGGRQDTARAPQVASPCDLRVLRPRERHARRAHLPPDLRPRGAQACRGRAALRSRAEPHPLFGDGR